MFNKLLVLLIVFLSSVSADELNEKTTHETDLDTLAAWMTGQFSSQEQSLKDSAYYDIRLVMTRIWPERTDGYWLYVEQAMAQVQERPYRQRVYHVTHVGEDIFESAVYTIDTPDSFAGAWKDRSRLAALTQSRIHPRTGCEIILRKRGGSFVGSTLGRLCGSDLHGASFATSEVSILPDRLISWDRGFDEDGAYIWGAAKEGYVFMKVADFPLE